MDRGTALGGGGGGGRRWPSWPPRPSCGRRGSPRACRCAWAPTWIRRPRRRSSPSSRSPPSCWRARWPAPGSGARTAPRGTGGRVRAALALIAAGRAPRDRAGRARRLLEVSPAYALLRMGGLRARRWPPWNGRPRARLRGIRALGLLGHETLVVYVLHLVLLFGGVLGHSPLLDYAGQPGLRRAPSRVLVAMVPVLYGAAWAWHRFKMRRPHARSARPRVPDRARRLGVPHAPVVSALMPLLWLDALAEADRERAGAKAWALARMRRRRACPCRTASSCPRTGRSPTRPRSRRPAAAWARWPSARRRRRKTPRRRASPASSARSSTCAAPRDVRGGRPPLPGRHRRADTRRSWAPPAPRSGSRSSSSSSSSRAGPASSSRATRAIPPSWSSSRTPAAARPSSPGSSARAATCSIARRARGASAVRAARGGPRRRATCARSPTWRGGRSPSSASPRTSNGPSAPTAPSCCSRGRSPSTARPRAIRASSGSPAPTSARCCPIPSRRSRRPCSWPCSSTASRRSCAWPGSARRAGAPFLVIHRERLYLNLTRSLAVAARLPGVSAADAESLVLGAGDARPAPPRVAPARLPAPRSPSLAAPGRARGAPARGGSLRAEEDLRTLRARAAAAAARGGRTWARCWATS